MEYKPLPIGFDDFRELITGGYYYIDKTYFIKELLDKMGKVNLFTRPRRFGKTLNMSMLQYFFENTGDEKTNKDNQALFDGMKIKDAGQPYLSEMSRYPVISLSLKSAKQPTWKLAYACLREVIENEFKRHMAVLPAIPIEADRKKYQAIVERMGEEADYVTSLAFLSRQLSQCYGQPAIILIDEYDVPLENAYFCGFYREMADFIRSLLESALKTNPSLYFAVITGCLRITKESIFTGLNNLKMNSILNGDYGEYFGFTPSEVECLLEAYHRSSALPTVREWYDGYTFGDQEVYNPWSLLNHLDALVQNAEAFPSPYWSNTSSNDIVRSLLERADASVRFEIENLIAGGTITKPVHEDITYEDVYSTMDNLWNFLFFTGYLKNNGVYMEDNRIYVKLSIPNVEIQTLYKDKVLGWFNETKQQSDLTCLYQAIWAGDSVTFQKEVTRLLKETISFYDNAESFYHGFLLGLLSGLTTCVIRSNREAGDGRYDILIQDMDEEKPVIIMELKAARTFAQLEPAAEKALAQIRERGYDREFLQEGYGSSIRYGIAFYKKRCRIVSESIGS